MNYPSGGLLRTLMFGTVYVYTVRTYPKAIFIEGFIFHLGALILLFNLRLPARRTHFEYDGEGGGEGNGTRREL